MMHAGEAARITGLSMRIPKPNPKHFYLIKMHSESQTRDCGVKLKPNFIDYSAIRLERGEGGGAHSLLHLLSSN